MSLLSGPLELIWGMAGLMKALLLDPAAPSEAPGQQNQPQPPSNR
jgi:hypothetical protein